MERVGIRIHNRRIELALTLVDVANHCGVSKSSVSRWEAGHIKQLSVEHIEKLSQILQVSPLYIIGIEENKSDALRTRLCNQIRRMNDNDLHRLDQMMQLMFKK